MNYWKKIGVYNIILQHLNTTNQVHIKKIKVSFTRWVYTEQVQWIRPELQTVSGAAI
jgi:hypothetical protein